MMITRESEDRLSRKVWKFRISTRAGSGARVDIHLNWYSEETRATTRHKFRADVSGIWDSFDQRSYRSGIKAKDVPLPDDVIEEAKRSLEITVHRPSA